MANMTEFILVAEYLTDAGLIPYGSDYSWTLLFDTIIKHFSDYRPPYENYPKDDLVNRFYNGVVRVKR